MKYIIDVPDDKVDDWINEAPLGKRLFIKVTFEEGKPYYVSTDIPAEPYTEPDRKDIENEVWKFAREYLRISQDEMSDIWEYNVEPAEAVMNTSYHEAKSKYEAWKAKRDEIRVGDEVVGIYNDGDKTDPFVVIKMVGTYYFGIYSESCEFCQGGMKLEKTNRHFPEVTKMLEQMKGEADG